MKQISTRYITRSVVIALVGLTAPTTVAALAPPTVLTYINHRNGADNLAYLGKFGENPALAVAGHASHSHISFLDPVDGSEIRRERIPGESGRYYFGTSVAAWRVANSTGTYTRGLVVGAYNRIHFFELDNDGTPIDPPKFIETRPENWGVSVACARVNDDDVDDIIIGDSKSQRLTIFYMEDPPTKPSIANQTTIDLGIPDSQGFGNSMNVIEENDEETVLAVGGSRKVWVLSIDKNGLATNEKEIVGTDLGIPDTSGFGNAVASGDLDMDGKKELIVGAPTYMGMNRGAIAIISFESGPLSNVKDYRVVEPDRSSLELAIRFGSSVAVIDLDDDMFPTPEIAVGCSSHNPPAPQTSHVVIFDEHSYCDDTDGDGIPDCLEESMRNLPAPQLADMLKALEDAGTRMDVLEKLDIQNDDDIFFLVQVLRRLRSRKNGLKRKQLKDLLDHHGINKKLACNVCYL